MVQDAGTIRRTQITTGKGIFSLTLIREDLSRYYPGMVRFTLRAALDGQELAVFRTNTYEYAPTDPADAETVAHEKADEWEHTLRTDPAAFLACAYNLPRHRFPPPKTTGVVVIQGSPRPGGNSAILAGWAVEAARKAGTTVQVLYPDESFIKPCIGCYQCYNTGTCIHDDDMAGIIHALNHAALIVLCTPVYTGTVPGGLKLLIDRCQALHAARTLDDRAPERTDGLLCAVCGRRGEENFACITTVAEAFFGNLGIRTAGAILIDDMDRRRDVRSVPDLAERVRAAVTACLERSQRHAPGYL